LSGILSPGDNFVIQDAQNFYGAPVASGSYAGGGVAIPMVNLPKVRPTGSGLAAPAHTAPLFGTFVVMAPGTRGVAGPPSGDMVAPAVAVTAPSTSQTVSATVTVSASATDNVGVAGVQFLVDGSNLGSEV